MKPSTAANPNDTLLIIVDENNMGRELAKQQCALGRRDTVKELPPCYNLMKYCLARTLVPLIMVVYLQRRVSLFDVNPVATWTFIICSFIYWAVAGMIKEMPDHCEPSYLDTAWLNFLNHTAILSASVSIPSILIFLLPENLLIMWPDYWILLPLGLATLFISFTVRLLM